MTLSAKLGETQRFQHWFLSQDDNILKTPSEFSFVYLPFPPDKGLREVNKPKQKSFSINKIMSISTGFTNYACQCQGESGVQ